MAYGVWLIHVRAQDLVVQDLGMQDLTDADLDRCGVVPSGGSDRLFGQCCGQSTPAAHPTAVPAAPTVRESVPVVPPISVKDSYEMPRASCNSNVSMGSAHSSPTSSSASVWK